MVVDADEAKKYTKVECMEPCVKNYCNLYTADLSERLGLDKTVLASYSLTSPILLNPMFGYEKRVVCSGGPMTRRQYIKGMNSE